LPRYMGYLEMIKSGSATITEMTDAEYASAWQ